VARSIQHSLCFGIYEGTGAQVGFARVVSDFATVSRILAMYLFWKRIADAD
jgi:hypothetical protein